ncbi:MAG: TIGR02266 family protein, partial [Polyangiaceae bacterium]
MSQDTRKDPRAKIVSLNVRYKSATVDEFIDNHASDVSKGGIFIKTSTPFPQGTLLKFEIRLAGDQSVIAGVGRVVWKRDPAAASGAQSPAGMGVKFIKLDDSSRAVIDKLVATREDAGSAFTSQLESDTTQVDHKSPVTGAGALKSTALGMGPSVKATIAGMGAVKPGTGGASGSSAPRPNAGNVKSTIMGMPTPVQPSSPPTAEAKPATGGGFFPGSAESAAADMPPPGERTVMKQAAELLEEALKEAGGSMDEVGTNPLFEKSKPPPAVEKLPEPTPADLAEEKAAAKAMERAETRPVEVPKLASDHPKAPAETVALAKATPKSEPPKARAVSAKSYVEEPEKKTSLAPFILITVALAGVALFFMFKNQIMGTTPVDTATPVTT